MISGSSNNSLNLCLSLTDIKLRIHPFDNTFSIFSSFGLKPEHALLVQYSKDFYLVETLEVLYRHLFVFEPLCLSMTYLFPCLSHLCFVFFQCLKTKRKAVFKKMLFDIDEMLDKQRNVV